MWSASMLVTTEITGEQVQEGGVGLVGLGDEELARPKPGIGAGASSGVRR